MPIHGYRGLAGQHQWIASCLVEMHQVVTFVLEKLDEEAEKERTEEVKEQT